MDFVIEKDARTTSKTAVLQCPGVPNGNVKTAQKTKPVKRTRKQKRTSKKMKKAKISNKETKECESLATQIAQCVFRTHSPPRATQTLTLIFQNWKDKMAMRPGILTNLEHRNVIHIHTFTHIHIFTHTHIYIHTYIHTYIHIYIYTYTHIRVCVCSINTHLFQLRFLPIIVQ